MGAWDRYPGSGLVLGSSSDSSPLKARTASDNAGSLRVLENAGFTIIDIEVSFAPGRGTGIEQTILRLG